MDTNTAGAFKAFIEAIPNVGSQAGGAVSVYADDAPEGKVEPYIVVVGPIANTPDKLEDGGTALSMQGQPGARATGGAQTTLEVFQLDLWQKWKNADNTLAESPTLPDVIMRALQGARLPAHTQVVYSCIVRGAPRMFERDTNLVHHPITVDVRRQL